MLALYLNSLNRLLGRDNPVMTMGQNVWRSLRRLFTARKTMRLAQQKLTRLEARQQWITDCMHPVQSQTRQRFEWYR